MMGGSDESLAGFFKASFSLPQRDVRTEREHAKGHQGAPGSSSPAQPHRRAWGWPLQQALGSAESTKKVCQKRGLFSANVPAHAARTGCTSLF